MCMVGQMSLKGQMDEKGQESQKGHMGILNGIGRMIKKYQMGHMSLKGKMDQRGIRKVGLARR